MPQPGNLGGREWWAGSSHTGRLRGLAAAGSVVAAAVQEPAPSCTWSCDCSRMNFLRKTGVTPVKNRMISPDLKSSGWCVRANLPLVGNHPGAEFVGELGLPSCGDQAGAGRTNIAAVLTDG